MADRDGERVGGVVRRRDGRQPEQQLHHVLHLRLLRAAIADDGALDLGGRVLEDRQMRLDGGEHRDAARVSELQRAADVCRVKQIFDRDRVRTALLEEARQPRVNREELVGKRRIGRRTNGAADNDPMA